MLCVEVSWQATEFSGQNEDLVRTNYPAIAAAFQVSLMWRGLGSAAPKRQYEPMNYFGARVSIRRR